MCGVPYGFILFGSSCFESLNRFSLPISYNKTFILLFTYFLREDLSHISTIQFVNLVRFKKT